VPGAGAVAVNRHDADRLRRVHDQLADAVTALASSDGWRRMLAVAARFHHYSPHNVLLIGAQRPDASRVAGYRAWQQLGRQVRKGEQGIAILAPVTYRTAATEGSAPGDATGPVEEASRARLLRGFRVAHVFDIGQTDGPELPEVRPRLVDGAVPAGLFERLTAHAAAAGFTVDRGPCTQREANGETSFLDRTVRVRDDLPAAQAVKTLAHELGHVLLHARQVRTERLTREVAEVEAESVAYLVTEAHGIDAGGYTVPYVAGWSGGATGVVLASAERVLSTAGAVLDAVAPDAVADPPVPVVAGRDMQRTATPVAAAPQRPALRLVAER
jgi:antirestriction protein ArdC